MKKVVVCLFAAFAAYVTFAGYAWFSSEINAILVSSDFPSKYRTLESPVKLYGSFSESYWTPPYAKVSYVTGEVTTENETTINVTTFADLNNYGRYDPSVSLGHYKDNCKQYVVDEFGHQYTFFDENVAAFYTKYESMNMNAAVNAFDQIKTKFQLWISSIRSQTGGLTYDASALAEKVKEIDNALDKASSQIANTAKEVEQRVAEFNQSIQEAQQHLANVANTQIENAQDLINGCVSDFSAFIAILEDALSSGEGWKEGAANAYSKITESEQKILNAIEALQPYASEPEVAQALVVLNQQKNTIAGLRSGLHAAITNPDEEAGKAAAQGILNSAKQAGLIDSKKAMKRIDNAAKTYQSQQRMLNTLQKAAIGTIDYVNAIESELDSIRESFNGFVINTMDNFHEIGAYLCSTNSMEYMGWRANNNWVKDMSDAELERWSVIQMQEPIFRSQSEKNEYNAFGPLHSKNQTGKYYNTFSRWLADNCFMMFYDLKTAGRFSSAYGINPVDHTRLRGFYEQAGNDGEGNITTNWYANKITAPKNWADGTSVVVKDGKFSSTVTNQVDMIVDLYYDVDDHTLYKVTRRVIVGYADEYATTNNVFVAVPRSDI